MKKVNHSRKETQRTRSKRQTQGNVLALSCVSFALVAIGIIVGLSFTGLLFINNRLQCSADEIALAGAKKINERDRIGQMNNMVARCRQLVFSSRQELEATQKAFPDLVSFAEPLLDESRDSAQQLEVERMRITNQSRTDALLAMDQRFNEIKSTYALTLPWLQVSAPRMTRYSFGKIDGVESNVEEMTQLSELAKNDVAENYVTQPPNPGIHLYKADTRNIPNLHRLPGQDSDLVFNLSSLPAPVDNIIAPARVTSNQKYTNDIAFSTPSAVKIDLSLQVQTKLGFTNLGTMKAMGVASTTGAGLQQ